jgi:hypothetical protein
VSGPDVRHKDARKLENWNSGMMETKKITGYELRVNELKEQNLE